MEKVTYIFLFQWIFLLLLLLFKRFFNLVQIFNNLNLKLAFSSLRYTAHIKNQGKLANLFALHSYSPTGGCILGNSMISATCYNGSLGIFCYFHEQEVLNGW